MAAAAEEKKGDSSEWAGFQSVDEVNAYLKEQRDCWLDVYNKQEKLHADHALISKHWHESINIIHNGNVQSMDEAMTRMNGFVSMVKKLEFEEYELLKWNALSCAMSGTGKFELNDGTKMEWHEIT
eukprot:UN06749